MAESHDAKRVGSRQGPEAELHNSRTHPGDNLLWHRLPLFGIYQSWHHVSIVQKRNIHVISLYLHLAARSSAVMASGGGCGFISAAGML
jgi:hypothetical protein